MQQGDPSPELRMRLSTFIIEFQHPLDILEPVTVRWNLEGKPVNESKILKVNTTMNNETGIIMTNLIFDPLDCHYDTDDVMDCSRRVYTCEAFIGNRFQDSAISEEIRLTTLCKRLNQLHTSSVHVHLVIKYTCKVQLLTCMYMYVYSCVRTYRHTY